MKKPGAKPRTLIPGFENNYSYIGNRGSTYYFQTNDGAPLLKVVALDIAKAKPVARTVIAEDKATLDGVSLVGGSLIASYLVDAKTEVRVHDLDGKLKRKIELPGIGTAGGFGGDFDDKETFFSFTSFNRPTTIYRYDVGERRGAGVGAAQGRVQPRRLFGRAALLRVEGRHQGADVHRPQEGRDRAVADFALRLWRVQRVDDPRLLADAAGVARGGRDLCHGQPSRRRRIWQGVA